MTVLMQKGNKAMFAYTANNTYVPFCFSDYFYPAKNNAYYYSYYVLSGEMSPCTCYCLSTTVRFPHQQITEWEIY